MAAIGTNTYNEAWGGAKQYLNGRLKAQTDHNVTVEIPVIDINLSFSPSFEDRKSVAAKIREACISCGFFYVKNHGIPNEVCEGILHQAQRLFKEYPSSKKQALHLKNSPHGYGWEDATDTSLHGDAERKEGFNWSYEEGLDPTGGDGGYVQLDGTKITGVNQWPDENDLPGFYDGIKAYYGPALQLARHLSRLFAVSLNLREDYFDSMITHPSGNARLMYYPGSKDEVNGDDSDGIGLGAHSDYQCWTVLLSSSTPGLEILSTTGQWVTAPAVEGGLIVNIGDMMMRWTNGLYKSTVHRVVNRTTEPRYSVPLFFGINNDQLVETLPSCITETNPSRYAPIIAGEYVLQRLATTRSY